MGKNRSIRIAEGYALMLISYGVFLFCFLIYFIKAYVVLIGLMILIFLIKSGGFFQLLLVIRLSGDQDIAIMTLVAGFLLIIFPSV